VTEDEANRRSKELNADLGAGGEERDFYLPVQREHDEWDVERQRPKLTWGERIWRLVDFLPP